MQTKRIRKAIGAGLSAVGRAQGIKSFLFPVPEETVKHRCSVDIDQKEISMRKTNTQIREMFL